MQIGFTKKAQNALNRALYYACEMGHTCVGSEHMLLGLLSEKEGVAESILERRGITFDATRELIREHVGTGEATRLTAADITPRTKKIIEASARVAMDLGHGYIGTEHLLCAICDEPECFAVGLMQAQGVVAADVKRDIVSYFGTWSTHHIGVLHRSVLLVLGQKWMGELFYFNSELYCYICNYHNSKSAYVFDLSKIYNPNVNAQPCFSLTATWYTKEELAEARKKVSNVMFQNVQRANSDGTTTNLLRAVALAGSQYLDFDEVGFVISTTNATPTVEGGYDYIVKSKVYA